MIQLEIVMARMSIIYWMVVHVICQTNVKTTQLTFWKEVQKILPDYEERKEWLRTNGDLLKI